ncbi:MAG: hypothetical protein ACTSU5_20285 [Promethearchaeota archaeon]
MKRHIFIGTRDGKVYLFPEDAYFVFDTANNLLTVDYEIHHKEFQISDIKSTLVDAGDSDLLVKFFEFLANKLDSDLG